MRYQPNLSLAKGDKLIIHLPSPPEGNVRFENITVDQETGSKKQINNYVCWWNVKYETSTSVKRSIRFLSRFLSIYDSINCNTISFWSLLFSSHHLTTTFKMIFTSYIPWIKNIVFKHKELKIFSCVNHYNFSNLSKSR